MVEHIRLCEYETASALQLTALERDVLTAANATVVPVLGADDRFDVRPRSTVGSIRVGGRQFDIAPKIGIRRLLFLLTWSLDDRYWRDELTEFGEDASLLEVIAAAFARQVDRALARGVVHGYRHREERGFAVKGRIELGLQVRREHGRLIPAHIAYDDHTVDTDANRLLLAAATRLRGIRVGREPTRHQLLRAIDRLDGVTHVRFHRVDLPRVNTTRLDAHYRPALGLARLILQAVSIETYRPATTVADALLFDMSLVFEDFVVNALRAELALSSAAFPRNDKRLHLDRAGRIRLEPDLMWIEAGRPIFLGDVKYKRVDARGVLHPDVYQVHAYARAAGLPSALLVYARGERDETIHQVVLQGPELEVAAIDLEHDLEGLRREVRRIAGRVRIHAEAGRSLTELRAPLAR
jgi:5-methylcytosine-specific restriction enzyme subunit McrC